MGEVAQVPSKARAQPATRLRRRGNKYSVASEGLAGEGRARSRALCPVDGHFPPVQDPARFQQHRKSLSNDYIDPQTKSELSALSKRPARHMGVVRASSRADVMHPVLEAVTRKGWGWTGERSGDSTGDK